jgi:hypothetical protein
MMRPQGSFDMPNTGPSGKHADAERLFKVAISTDQQLLPVEFEHLKRCLWCLEQFSYFVRQNLQDKRKSRFSLTSDHQMIEKSAGADG